MTIIAYRFPTMACDGRVVDLEDNTVVSNNLEKIYRLKDHSLIGIAGDADHRETIELFNKYRRSAFPSTKQLLNLGCRIAAILVFPDQSIWSIDVAHDKEDGDYAQIVRIKEEFFAVGTGYKFAIGAMDRGASAIQAVKTAIKYDANCGGHITSLRLE